MSLSVPDIEGRLRMCKEKIEHFRRHGKRYRQKHLNRRLQLAQEKEDEAAENQILAIIRQERDRAFWRRINYTLGKKRGRSVREVEVEDEEGTTTIFNQEAEVHQAIWGEIHNKQFYSAEKVPICQGRL